MANSLLVFALDAPGVREWLAERGELPSGLPPSIPPTAELLTGVVRELGWPCVPAEAGGLWRADIGHRDGSYPPVSDMTLSEGTLSFRLGPTYGPWLVCTRVAQVCGPQVAMESGSVDTALVLPTTSYEDFHQSLFGCPPRADGRDREWSTPPSPEDRHRLGLSLLNQKLAAGQEVSVEESLDYAISGQVGCGNEAMAVGQAIQAFRHRPQPGGRGGSHPRILDQDRYLTIVDQLRGHLAGTPLPIPELVWAFGQSRGAVPDLRLLVERLQDDPRAMATVEMAEVFIRSSPD